MADKGVFFLINVTAKCRRAAYMRGPGDGRVVKLGHFVLDS